MILESDPAEEFRMRYFNADGGEATMCGNGGRCIALFAHHLGIGGMRKRFIGVDGPHTAELLRVEGPEGEIRLGMIDVRRVEVHPEYLFLDTGSRRSPAERERPPRLSLRPCARAARAGITGSTSREARSASRSNRTEREASRGSS